MRKASAFAPATVANLGVGFDILGLALREPGDTVHAGRVDDPGVTIAAIEGDDGKLPLDPGRNTAGVAAESVLRTAHANFGVRLIIQKGLPRASGLGSSAASAVAAAVAVNALLDEPLPRDALLPACLDGEELVSGRHADNVAPCLFGGITLVWGVESSQIVRLPVPENLYLALVTPALEVPTAEARAVLPQTVPLKAMVSQTAAVARLIYAIHCKDLEAMAAAMEADGVIEPARAHLMPLLNEIRQVAKNAGSLGLIISGAGPTLCAVCADERTALRVAEAMHRRYAESAIESTARTTQVSEAGAKVIA
jgi:homoserine kinase